MIKFREKINLKELRTRLAYAPDTGVFRWLIRPRRRACSEIAGLIHPFGYRVIGLNQVIYKAHRLAWFHYYGEWPKDLLDHINGDRSDNRICNLRETNKSGNAANSKTRKTNRCGFKGVTVDKYGKYQARLCKNYKTIYLGYFDTPNEAHAAYLSAAKSIHGEFAREA